MPPLPPGYASRSSGAGSQTFSSFQSADGPVLPPGSGGTNGGTIFGPPYTFDTNGLWLEITGLDTNGFVYCNLRNATGQIYAIRGAGSTNLPGSWNVELELWPTNSTVMPFTVQTLNRSNLFLLAEDWTGVTENGNTTPDWWLWRFYNTTALSDTNLDSTGQNTLLYDYQNGLDPNVIAFSVSATNNYVATSATTVQLAVSQGTPFYSAALVDSTNFSGATWNAYTSSNTPVVLGLTEGWHDVWIGLRGKPADATVTWQWKRLKLDFTPPALILNGPSNVVSQSIIEITGYSPEALSQLSYDLSNTNGLFTNQPVLVLDQVYDTNSFEFTTNTFQAFDVPLAPGTNLFTFHATDLAGNVTTTNFVFVLVSDTNAPMVNLVWPQDGMQVSGTNFTVFGMVDDISSTITATMVDTNGNTNIYNALIERNGQFWFEDLPLTAGTNSLTLTAMDPWGNTTVTNFSVTQSSVTLTVDTIDTTHLYLPTISLTGTVSDPAAAIWVNGVQGTNHGDGTWSATNVSITGGGTARFVVSAYPAADSVSSNTVNPQFNPPAPNSANASTNVDKPSRVYMDEYHKDESISRNVINVGSLGYEDSAAMSSTASINWSDGIGGTSTYAGHVESTYPGQGTQSGDCSEAFNWSQSFYPDMVLEPSTNDPTDACNSDSPPSAPMIPAHEKITLDSTIVQVAPTYVNTGTIAGAINVQAKIKFYTGGKAGVNRQNLWALLGSATEHRVVDYSSDEGLIYYGTTNIPVDPTRIKLGDVGMLGNDGIRWTTLPNDVTKDVTPTVSGMDWYDFQVSAQEYKLTILVNGSQPLSEHKVWPRTTFCVGQYLQFSDLWSPSLPAGTSVAPVQWQFDGAFVNQGGQLNCGPLGAPCGSFNYKLNPSLLQQETTWAWWITGKSPAEEYTAQIQETLNFTNGQSVSVAKNGLFGMYRPTIASTALEYWGTPQIVISNGKLSVGNDSETIPGMSFACYVNSSFSGKAGWTQLISGEYDSDVSYSIAPAQLDNQYWTPGGLQTVSTGSPAENQIPFTDQPGISLAVINSITAMDLSFQTYLRFKPDAGDPDQNIYVTLKLATWGVSASATKSAGVWAVDSGSSISGPSISDSDAFPVWEDVFSNQ